MRDITLVHAEGKHVPGEARLVSVDFDRPAFADGWTRAAQMFLCLFFTDAGSVPSEPSRGTSFAKKLLSGAIRDEMQLKTEFEFAMRDVQVYLTRSGYYASTPPPEQLADAKLVRWSLDGANGLASLTVDLISGTGEAYRYDVPLTWKNAHDR